MEELVFSTRVLIRAHASVASTLGRPSLFLCVLWFLCGCGWGSDATSNFLTLDGFKAKPGIERGEVRFKGYGGYEVVLATREGLSRLGLRFGPRSVALTRTGEEHGYDDGSWLANKPLEWRGVKVRGVFEPYALIFRALRHRQEGGRPSEAYVVVSLEGCDSRVIGAFPAEGGPLEAVRHADRYCVRGDAPGQLPVSRRFLIEKMVTDWLAAVRIGDEKRLRDLYSAVYLRANARRAGKFEDVLKRVARFGEGEASGFSIKEEGGQLDVAFSLHGESAADAAAEPLRIRLGMVNEGGGLKISREADGEVVSEKKPQDKGASPVAVKGGESTTSDSESELYKLLVGRWLASDGKGMMSLVFEEGGQLHWRRLGAPSKTNPVALGTWMVRGSVVTVDLGKGEEERKLTPIKGGRFRLEGRGGVLFVEKQR